MPERFQNKSIPNLLRRLMHGMSSCLDEAIGNVTSALRARGMWEDTIVLYTSDNGGAVHDPASGCLNEDPDQPGAEGANNYPLRGHSIA